MTEQMTITCVEDATESATSHSKVAMLSGITGIPDSPLMKLANTILPESAEAY
jgi:hypothetical protein